jgi:hypothetical protein
VNISDKHFEIVVRKMTNRVQITGPGDSHYLPGDMINRLELARVNEKLTGEGKKHASGVPVLLGISKAALATESFLSASSFQHTIKVLAQAAIEGRRDDLVGLKENVILGKLIPAGTGFKNDAMDNYEGVILPASEAPIKSASLIQAEKALLGVGEGERLAEEQIPSLEDLIASAQKAGDEV